ncbi:hypothetical protein A3863_04650 [Priestia endophytica]|uniref:hypothetical protein n=1 Tax=Priestia endophytica TaxID=135735 RepID=UPI000DCA3406|nr:hypothetical protein [Priestia endophytica]RAS91773.1 hypothetical protein A3863_04650 [Priestia endophytica]
MEKKEFLLYKKKTHLTQLDGFIEADVDYEEFHDNFLDWLHEKGWTYCGFTGPLENEEEATEVFEQSLKSKDEKSTD